MLNYRNHIIKNINYSPRLHKKGKKWIVVGITLLSLMGLGFTTNSNKTHASVRDNINPNFNNNNSQSSSNNNNKSRAINSNNIFNQSKVLHQRIIENSMKYQHAHVINTNQSNNQSKVLPQKIKENSMKYQHAYIVNTNQSKTVPNFIPTNDRNKTTDNNQSDQINKTNTVNQSGYILNNKQNKVNNINTNKQGLNLTESKNKANQVKNEKIEKISASKVNATGTKIGVYNGLNYNFDPNTSTLEFTGGKIGWNNGIGKTGNYGTQEFIGGYSNKTGKFNDEDSRELYGQDAPTFMNTAKHIIFRNVDASTTFANSNANYFIAQDPYVESIDLGSDFDKHGTSSWADFNTNGMFASDKKLKTITIPDGLFASYNQHKNVFLGDNNLYAIKILPTHVANEPGWANAIKTQFNSNIGLNYSNWYQTDNNGNSTTKTNITNSQPLSPGTYLLQQGNINHFTNLREGTSHVDINGNTDTITVSGGQLANGIANNFQEFISDLKATDGTRLGSDSLPNDNQNWKITFTNHPTTHSNLAFVFSGGKESSTVQNALGNQVSKIDFNGLDTSNANNMQGMLINSNDLKEVNFGNIDTSNVTNMDMMLGSDRSLVSVNLSNLSGKSLKEAWDLFDTDPLLQHVVLGANFSPRGNNHVQLSEMFASDLSLTFNGIDWNGFNTSNVGTMYGFFRNDNNLGNIILPNSFDTSNVTNFGYDTVSKRPGSKLNGMFQSDSSTKLIDLSQANFDTSKATNMASMFRGDKQLKNINFGNKFNTSNANDMSYMFGNSDAISDLSLPATFITTQKPNLTGMFESDISYQKNNTSNKLKTITINSSDTKLPTNNPVYTGGYQYGVNTWGYWSDNYGSVDDNNPSMYKELSNGYTSSDKNDFSDGNIGTFTTKFYPKVSANINITNERNNQIIKTIKVNGGKGNVINYSDYKSNIPNGYRFDKLGKYNNNTLNQNDNDVIEVIPDNINITVNYNDGNNTVKTSSINGDYGSNISDNTINSLNNNIPSGYQFSSDASNNPTIFNFNQTFTINIKRKQTITGNITVNYNIDGKTAKSINLPSLQISNKNPTYNLPISIISKYIQDGYTIPSSQINISNSDINNGYKNITLNYNANSAGNMTIHYVDSSNGNKLGTVSYSKSDINNLCPYIKGGVQWLSDTNVELAPYSDRNSGMATDNITGLPILYILGSPGKPIPVGTHLENMVNDITLQRNTGIPNVKLMHSINERVSAYVTFSK